MSAAPVADNSVRRTIGDILLAHGFVSEETLADAIAEQERTAQPLGQILVRRGVISRLDLASALAEQWSDPTASVMPLPLTRPGTPLTLQPSDDSREIEAVGDRVAELADQLDAALARTQELENDFATIAEVNARPVEAAAPDPLLLERIEELGAAVDALAERPFADEVARGRVDEIAARLETLVDGASFDDLRSALAELERRPVSDPELGARLERVEALAANRAARTDLETQEETLAELREAVANLEARPVGNPQLDERLEQIETVMAERLASLAQAAALDDLATRVDELAHAVQAQPTEVIVERPDDGVLRARLDEIEARLGSSVASTESVVAAVDDLRAALDELSERRHDEQDAATRLETLSATVAELMNRPGEDPTLEARIGQLERGLEHVAEDSAVGDLRLAVDGLVEARATSGAAVAEFERRLDALESTPPVPDVDHWAEEAASLGRRIDALAAIVSDAPERPMREPSAPDEPQGDTELELERLRMAIERMSMHLGEQERALAETMRSRDVSGRLEALESRIDDVEAAPTTGVAGGTASPGAGSSEARALTRRLDSAEAQLAEERERMFTKMERIASAIAWRLERLETITQPGPDE